MYLLRSSSSWRGTLGIIGILVFLTACEEKATQAQVSNEGIPEYTRTLNVSGWETKVSSLNVFGLKVVSPDKKERMPAIGRLLKEQQPDFAFMQEAWTEEGRKDIFSNSNLKYNHYYPVQLTVGSGIQMLSTVAFERQSFRVFTLGGRVSRITEGEAWAGKGIGMSRVTLKGLPVSMFNTHLVARHGSENQNTSEDRYTPERLMQLFEVFAHIVEQTDSDAFILAGDFNQRYFHIEYDFWNKLSSLDGIKFEEQDHTFCTSCGDNSYRDKAFNGQLDYIYVSPRLLITNAQRDFDQRIKKQDGSTINLSDHYGLVSTIGAITGSSGKNPTLVRKNTTESLAYLQYRLEDYLNWYDKDKSDVDAKGLEDKICVKCNIETSLKAVKRYQEALASNNPAKLPNDLKRIRTRLDSYFQIFR
ncbi:MAG: endonuclease/exonuclease/phosphatase family protein [Oligoflexia bacterium]|nr:endonuclease/exonuclease/phosphatase family protein [Oligoflexia bacterium]